MPKHKLITYDGRTMNVKDWAAHLGISPVTLGARLGRYGMTPAQALTGESLAVEASGNHYPVVSIGHGAAKREHTLLAEKALGRRLPPGAEVHHLDEDITNNAPSNLVICPSHAHHALLHMRAAAHAACGHYDWRKCVYCKTWGDPATMTITKQNRAHHARCHADYHANLRAQRQGAPA